MGKIGAIRNQHAQTENEVTDFCYFQQKKAPIMGFVMGAFFIGIGCWQMLT